MNILFIIAIMLWALLFYAIGRYSQKRNEIAIYNKGFTNGIIAMQKFIEEECKRQTEEQIKKGIIPSDITIKHKISVTK